MMIRNQRIACFAALLISLTAYGQSPQTTMKGYELYSWKIKSHWYYSVLPRTDRLKTYEEITAPSTVTRDAAGLRSALRKLPKGEQVFWMSDAPAGADMSTTGQTINVKHPSRQRIKGVKAICDKIGIKLRLT